MNGSQGIKLQNIEKRYPGCLGRMVNLFDFGTGVGGKKLLTDEPHLEASSLSRSRSDVTRLSNLPFEDQIQDKVVVPELRRTASNRVNGTPIKKLIAHEMSKEGEYKHSPTNVVAKLMGLETLPLEQLDALEPRSNSKYSRHLSNHIEVAAECCKQDCGFVDEIMHSQALRFKAYKEYKDVYEIPQQRQKNNKYVDGSPRKGKYNDNPSEKRKTALVHQKFIEAQRLVTDEKLRRSKNFQDAMEVLSSNKDLFLRLLQESNSLSQHLYDFQSVTPPSDTKRITILRPSKMVDDETFVEHEMKGGKQTKKTASVVSTSGWESNSKGYSLPVIDRRVEQYPKQQTRIVVLKPSSKNGRDNKDVVSPSSSPPVVLNGDDYYEQPGGREARESRPVAKKITQKMRKNLTGVLTDESRISSVLSNSCDGDDVFSNLSHRYYTAENLSDLEILSPPSRHSWDFVTRFDSPYSCSSFSRASYSPESSVFREAKKRLSERWALMASSENFHAQKPVSKSSGTLGEMLALSDIKELVRSKEESKNKEKEPRAATSYLTSNPNEEFTPGPPNSLQRSKSVPVSSTVYGSGLNGDTSASKDTKAQVPELTKSKSTKSSLKGKVSNFFFSRGKKSTTQKSSTSQSKEVSQLTNPETPISCVNLGGKASDAASLCIDDSCLEEHSLHLAGQMKTHYSPEAGLSVEKPIVPGVLSGNSEQPSPCSVLEPPFEEDQPRVPGTSCLAKPELGVCLKSNLIDKSPPIGSVARTLSLDDSCVDTATQYPVKLTSALPGTREEDDWHFLVHSLLSASGLDVEAKPEIIIPKWHSDESPLDPSLRDKYANLDNKEQIYEAKRRQQRSRRKLVFDMVNAALLEFGGQCYSDRSTGICSHAGFCNKLALNDTASLEDWVWAWTKKWFFSSEGGVTDSEVVERVVREEVAGNGCAENLRAELDQLGKQIEVKLLEELVEEYVVDLTAR